MTTILLGAVNCKVVEGHLFAFYQSQEVFDYALHRNPLDRLKIVLLNLITLLIGMTPW